MKPFVGVKTAKSVDELLDLMKKLATESSYYFLRWTHKVSGITEKQPTEAELQQIIEGQMFNYLCELRWKKKDKDSYEMLLLTIDENHHSFMPIKKIKDKDKQKEPWRIEPNNPEKFPSYAYPAYGYRPDETRFPKGFDYSETLDIRLGKDNKKQPKLAQRYFIDAETSAVQFVALTLEVH
ncbi:MAG: hypothetical protein ACRAVC_12575 [Trichormus sp.]